MFATVKKRREPNGLLVKQIDRGDKSFAGQLARVRNERAALRADCENSHEFKRVWAAELKHRREAKAVR